MQMRKINNESLLICENEFDIIIIVENCLEQMERELPVAGIGSFLFISKTGNSK